VTLDHGLGVADRREPAALQRRLVHGDESGV